MIGEGSNLLLNLLVILITLAIHQFWIESKPNSPFVKKYAILFTSAAAILLCMVFSFYYKDGIRFDLRRIPLWIGTIYGGPLIGIILSLETIIVRFFTGGSGGVLITSITTPLFTAITLLIRPYYFRLKTHNKVLLAASATTLFSICILISVTILQNRPLPFDLWGSFLLTNLVGIVIVNLSIEAIRKNYLTRMRIFHADKIDTVGHLAAAVNHEVKNPLTTVRGMMDLLREGQSLPDEKREAFFELATEEIDRIDKIVTDYLTFAKPYPDKIEQISIEKVLTEAVNIVQPLANQTNIKLEISFSDPYYVSGDYSKFVQALVNILKNSIDASANGGQIKVKAERKENLCKITIVDHGVGMNEETLNKLGEPFFSMTSKGTGLGMMVVFRIIECMKGTINIKSKSGAGTEVIIVLPIVSDDNVQKDNILLLQH